MGGMKQTIAYFGSITKMATALKCHYQSIQFWEKNGIPVKRAIQIEEVTDGAISRQSLRPDIFE